MPKGYRSFLGNFSWNIRAELSSLFPLEHPVAINATLQLNLKQSFYINSSKSSSNFKIEALFIVSKRKLYTRCCSIKIYFLF
jgi:hypothetical protein